MHALPGNIVDIATFLPRNQSRPQKLSLLGLEEKIKSSYFILKLKPLEGKHLFKIPQQIGSKAGPGMQAAWHSGLYSQQVQYQIFLNLYVSKYDYTWRLKLRNNVLL